ncbi:15997_t:CDS:2 [Funneliformis caledonium]|uniref:15997_t:CDS:1 n=1 Tax=Funneliformis caledonium TaxID=1117310 RepID=A0A9N9EC42_9GLOM|nr:15997_t:CDS:2 [Funneliformis caledonium]
MAPLFADSLLRDICQLLNDTSNCDVIIEVGNEREPFKAHFVILGARSPYLKTALTSNLVKKENDMIIFTMPNTSPKVFGKILKYIYTGEFLLTDEEDIQEMMLDLLIVADELALLELVKYMEEYIITFERDWIQENLAKIFSTASKYEKFTRLWKQFCGELLAQRPNALFTSSYFLSLKRSTLLTFIKRNDLNIDESEIWKNLIKWACEQTPKLCHEVERLTQDDFKELESRLKDFIPFIRFFSITKDQYILGVLPYENILPDSLRNELKKFFESNEEKSPPKNFCSSRIPITQTVPDSVLINNKHMALLASWIDSKDNDGISFNISKNVYEFNLLLRGSRDGKTIREFHKFCINKGPTLVIIKVKGTNQIIGGYNPEPWNLEYGLKYNEGAFICSLGGGDKNFGIILSRAKYNEMSIRNAPNLAIGFMDLGWFEGRYNHLYFEKRIMESTYKEFIQDYEVFQVCKKIL